MADIYRIVQVAILKVDMEDMVYDKSAFIVEKIVVRVIIVWNWLVDHNEKTNFIVNTIEPVN